MPVAYKAVLADGKSPMMTGQGMGGSGAFSPAQWALLQLDYGLGLTAEPDPAVELAVKAGNPAYADAAAESAGLRAYGFRVGQLLDANTTAAGQVPYGGHVVVLDYQEADVIASSFAPGYGCSSLQLRKATATGIWSAVTVHAGVASTVELQVAVGDAAGTVSVQAVDENTLAVVATGTATNMAEAGRYTFLLPALTGPTTVVLGWTGTWAAVSRTFTTRARVR